MLEDVNRSAESVAQVLDFPSGSAFRNTCERYLHSTPQQIRDQGGARYVIDAFMRTSHAEAAGNDDGSDGDGLGDEEVQEAVIKRLSGAHAASTDTMPFASNRREIERSQPAPHASRHPRHPAGAPAPRRSSGTRARVSHDPADD